MVCFVSQSEITPFKPFNHRFPTPYWATNSTSPQWYSVRRGPAHIIVLSSYSAYGILPYRSHLSGVDLQYAS